MTDELTYRVTYADTDKMGYMYHGNYARLYEMGRTELMRSMGICYRLLEDDHGFLLPVYSMQIRFLRPAKYDQVLKVCTDIQNWDLEGSIRFRSEIFNEDNKMVNAGTVSIRLFSFKEQKSIVFPPFILQILNNINGKSE